MNRTHKDATVHCSHDPSHDELRVHLRLFLDACNYARSSKVLRGVTQYELICRVWTKEPERFERDPSHHTREVEI